MLYTEGDLVKILSYHGVVESLYSRIREKGKITKKNARDFLWALNNYNDLVLLEIRKKVVGFREIGKLEKECLKLLGKK